MNKNMNMNRNTNKNRNTNMNRNAYTRENNNLKHVVQSAHTFQSHLGECIECEKVSQTQCELLDATTDVCRFDQSMKKCVSKTDGYQDIEYAHYLLSTYGEETELAQAEHRFHVRIKEELRSMKAITAAPAGTGRSALLLPAAPAPAASPPAPPPAIRRTLPRSA